MFESLDLIHQGLLKKEITFEDILASYFKRIAALDKSLKAFLTVDEAYAYRFLRNNLESLNLNIKEKPLLGLPIGIKDNIAVKDMPLTCASKMLEDYISIYDATVVTKLREAGVIIVGKTNLDEFAMGSSSENSAFFCTKNPFDLTRVPGGSSGGSACAVAAGEVYFSLGSDTGGSIRQPASFCGLVGLKPTYGRVSRFGLVAFASSLDQIGTLTKNTKDAAYLLKVIAGYDPKDATSANIEVADYPSLLTGKIEGIRIGIITEMMKLDLDRNVRERIVKATQLLEDLGAIVEEVSLPHLDYAVSTYYIIASAEASSNLARYDGVCYGKRAKANNLLDMYFNTFKEGFGKEVKRRLMLGTYVLSSGYYDAYYLKAQKVRTLIRNDFLNVFKKYDLLIGPTTKEYAFKLGEKIKDPLSMYISDVCTIPANLAGLPAISLPCGLVAGLPVGLQLIGKPFDEGKLLNVAYTLENALNLNLKPSLEVKDDF